MTAIRIVLADDHRLFREGLMSMLAREADIECVAEALDGQAALKLCRQHQPDLLVTDIAMPGLNGLEALRRLRSEMPEMRVLVLSAHDDERLVLAAMEAGANGYVLKDCAGSELAAAVRTVAAGRIHLAGALAGIFVRQFRGQQGITVQKAPGSALTPREREMVQLFSEGHTTSDIAARLHLSVKTVATHRENILHKLQISGVAEMTRYALREGLSSLDAPCRSASA